MNDGGRKTNFRISKVSSEALRRYLKRRKFFSLKIKLVEYVKSIKLRGFKVGLKFIFFQEEKSPWHRFRD